MSTTVGTSSTTRFGRRLVALAGATASLAALGGVSAATPASARPAETSVGTTSTTDCNRDLGTSALKFRKRSWPLNGGLHMDTYNGTVGRTTGSVAATTHLYNSYWGTGYTGSTMIVLYNSCDEPIGVTTPQRWGVDAKAWFWNTNERYEWHSQQLPTTITRKAARVEVIHNRVSGGNDYTKYNKIRDAACSVVKPLFGGYCPLPPL